MSFVSLIVIGFLMAGCHLIKRSQAKKEEISKRGIASAIWTPALPSFVWTKIPAGKFEMGSPGTEKDRKLDENQVPVQISKPFKMMTTELTQWQWYQVKGTNPSRFKGLRDCTNHKFVNGKGICPDNPVESVSWHEVQEYIKELNALKGFRGCDKRLHPRARAPYNDNCYRLPTEAEWEWAVRAETKTVYFFGDSPHFPFHLERYAVYRKNSRERTHTVGRRNPNRWGLYDMYGNVWEWVQDAWRRELPGGRDPLVIGGSLRVIRGGGWFSNAKDMRSANRNGYSPDVKPDGVGFRLVRTL